MTEATGTPEPGPAPSVSPLYSEILSQPEAWQNALDRVAAASSALQEQWQRAEYREVVFTGCGSSYYLSLAAASLYQAVTGTTSRAVPAGELVLHPATTLSSHGRTLIVAVSRSGETTETVRAARTALETDTCDLWTLTNSPGSALGGMGAVNLSVPGGQEVSIAQTRSFTSMYVATTAVALLIGEGESSLQTLQPLPEIGRQIISSYEEVARSLGADLDIDRFYFLGSGLRYGLAAEASLKMKEMTLSHSEPFHFLEFRHGPISMVESSALVVGALSSQQARHEWGVMEDVRRFGGRTLSIAASGADISVGSDLPAATAGVLCLPALQLMAYHRAVAKGLDPSTPRNLDFAVTLDWD